MPTEQMRRATSAPWCGSVLKSPTIATVCGFPENTLMPKGFHAPPFPNTQGCLHRCLGTCTMREVSRCQLRPLRRRARLRKACDVSTVARRCRSSTECLFAATPEPIQPKTVSCRVLCGLVQVPAAASSSTRNSPPPATSSQHPPPMNGSSAFLDTTRSIPVQSDRAVEQDSF
jgi:hypothetical protein